MNKITRRRSPRWGSSKGKPNPFESRGLDKFQEVYSELEKMRSRIAEQEGVATSDVWFTRGTSNGSRDWIPVVVGKSRGSSTASRLEKKASIPHYEEVREIEEDAAVKQVVSESSLLRTGSFPSFPSVDGSQPGGFISWFCIRFEQFVLDLQRGARKALKSITLFIMIVAAVTDVLIALVSGFASSLVARYLRPLWARFLPLCFTQQHSKDLSFSFPVAVQSISTPPQSFSSCASAPVSPRYCHLLPQSDSPPEQKIVSGLRKQGSSASTPVSPVRTNSPTYFSSERPPASPVRCHPTYFSSERPGSSSSPPRTTVVATTTKRVVVQRFQKREPEYTSPAEEARGATPVMCIVLVILVGLSFGRLTSLVMASMVWFLFPVVEKLKYEAGLRKS